jgi:hypothetical protein
MIHFLYFAPGIGARWFFTASRLYWQTFRPIVIYDLDVVQYGYNAPDIEVIITSIARTDTAEQVRATIAERYPGADHDELVYDYMEFVALTLDARVEENQPFGRPEAS